MEEWKGLRPLKRSLAWADNSHFFYIFTSPQKRHPERSASRIYRVTQRLMARSRRTPTVLIVPMPLGAFHHRSPLLAVRQVFALGRGQELIDLIRRINPEFK
jgi:hypothetical protein